MSLRVNNNIGSLSALNKLRANDMAQQKSLERLSSGLRINKASDDPSGLVVSEKLRGQITSLNQAMRNTQNNINMINTAEAALSEIGDILVDIRSSVVFALNTGFASGDQIRAEQDKINQSLVAIDRIASSTRFANRNLLNGESDFLVNKSAGAAFDDLTVRSVRMAPGAEQTKFEVNVSQLAERATLVTNADVRADHVIVDGNGSDFATLRVRGDKGTADIQLGAGSTVQDFISAVNQNTATTGVYAASHRPMALDSGSSEFVIRGAGAGVQLNGNGQDLVFGVRLGDGKVENVVVNSGAGAIVTAGDLESALQNIDANFEVYEKDGDLFIRNADNRFELTGAENVRSYTITAAQLATIFDANEDGDPTSFGDIGFDVLGNGSITADDEEFTFANTGGPGVDTPEDIEAMIAAIRGMDVWGDTDNVAIHMDGNGNMVIMDMTGSIMGSQGNSVGLVNRGADDGLTASAINGYQSVTSYSGDLAKLSGGGKAHDEAVSFINFNMPSDFISNSGELRISTEALEGGTLDFVIKDAHGNEHTIQVTDGTIDDYITLADIQTALEGISNDDPSAGGYAANERSSYVAYFDKVGGLTIVDRYGGHFTMNETPEDTTTTPEVDEGTDLKALFGKKDFASTSNHERLALYSTEFGASKVISIEDVTAPTSGVTMTSALNGGLTVTGDGRDGLGALAGTANTMQGLSGGMIQAAGKDVKGNISGVAFAGNGFHVDFVTNSLDVSFTLGEHFGRMGDAGKRADAASFGFAAHAGLDGASRLNPLYAGQKLPNGYLDRVDFAIRQSFGGGPGNVSGMRFQIRETNNATDSIHLGIRQVSTATLGGRLTPETGAGSESFEARFMGGALNTMRTGGGNDLLTNPNNALDIVDRAIDQVTGLRSYLGSVAADTLQRNLNSVGVAVENLTGAQSFIRDLDFAEETTNFTKAQIMFQASTSVLAASNSTQQAVLGLLQGI
jgi:flagellin-like hook-associated protein FlgL